MKRFLSFVLNPLAQEWSSLYETETHPELLDE